MLEDEKRPFTCFVLVYRIRLLRLNGFTIWVFHAVSLLSHCCGKTQLQQLLKVLPNKVAYPLLRVEIQEIEIK
jgi:hypothetical protein